MAVRRIATAVVAAVLCVGVAGCGGDASSADPTPTATASAKPTPSKTGPVAPVLPELAKRNDAVGAKAFLKYWFAAVSYAMKTGDTEPFMAVSAKNCKTCEGLADKIGGIYSKNRRLEGGGWRVIGVEQDPGSKGPFWRLAVKVVQPAQRVVGQDGTVVSEDPRDQALFYAGIEWRDGYSFMGLERIDD